MAAAGGVIAALALGASVLSSGQTAHPQGAPREPNFAEPVAKDLPAADPVGERHEVLASELRRVSGVARGFQSGCYLLNAIVDVKGDERPFVSFDDAHFYFLAAHRNRHVVVSYRTVNRFDEKFGEYAERDEIEEIQAGSVKSSEWWAALCRKAPESELEAKFEKAVAAATR